MKNNDIRWFSGEPEIQKCVMEAAADSFQSATVLQTSSHRTILRVPMSMSMHEAQADANDRSTPTPSLVLKIHRLATGPHPLRDRVKRWLRFSPARREWKALEALFALDVPVPAPRAWGRLANGDEIVVTDFVDGDPLAKVSPNEKTREDLTIALGDAIKRLHDAGYRHGDLHLGNLIRTEKAIVILDLQRARPNAISDDRLWDLARLEFSLTKGGWKPSDRRALRDRLGAGHAFDPILRRFLRDHLRGRARRMLRVGENWSRARVGPLRGLRDVSLEAETLTAIVAATSHGRVTHERRGGRVQIIEVDLPASYRSADALLVKRIAAGSLKRAIGDRLRGTAAARAFHAGQASGILSGRAARPLAYLEERRFGLPIQSLLILEKVGAGDLDQVRPSSIESELRLARALGEWLAEGHAWGLSHRDFKASNIRVEVHADSTRFWMVDLEDLGGPMELSEEARLEALIQLNASIDDDIMSVDARLAVLESYEVRLPFGTRNESPAKTIARRSLAKAHRWRNDEGTCRRR